MVSPLSHSPLLPLSFLALADAQMTFCPLSGVGKSALTIQFIQSHFVRSSLARPSRLLRPLTRRALFQVDEFVLVHPIWAASPALTPLSSLVLSRTLLTPRTPVCPSSDMTQ